MPDPDTDRQIKQIQRLCARIGPQLAGLDPMVQGGALADRARRQRRNGDTTPKGWTHYVAPE